MRATAETQVVGGTAWATACEGGHEYGASAVRGWCLAGGPRRSMPAVSPASGETFASVAVAEPAGRRRRGRGGGRRGWTGWAALSAFERAAHWRARPRTAIAGRAEDLARVLTKDQGKPLAAEALRRGRGAGRVLPDGRGGCHTPRPVAHRRPRRPDRRVLTATGTARRGRRDQPVELAVHDGRGAVRARHGRGQHGRLGARADHLGVLRDARGDHRSGGDPRRGVQLPAGPWTRGR